MNQYAAFLFIIFFSCGSEQGIEVAKPYTFVRYYNGGYNDEAKLIRQNPDGSFVILSTGDRFGAKVIKIDVYGNPVWQSTFFPLSETNNKVTDIGKDLLLLNDGYLLLGESNIIVMDSEGKTVTQNTLTKSDGYPNINFGVYSGTIKGASSIVNAVAPNNYLITGLSADSTMYFGELDKNTYKWVWLNAGGKANSIGNKLYLDATNKAYWTATTIPGKITLLQVPQRTTPTSAPSIGTIRFNQTASDLSRHGNGFVLSGTTNERGDKDICYYLLTTSISPNGDSKLIEIAQNSESKVEVKTTSASGGGQVVVHLPGDQVSNSISSTQDGGFIILGTGQSAELPGYEKKGNSLEYILIKVDGFGNLESGWPKYYGSKSDDQGASIIQAKDGSFMILGTTDLGGAKTIFLMKTDKEGNIN